MKKGTKCMLMGLGLFSIGFGVVAYEGIKPKYTPSVEVKKYQDTSYELTKENFINLNDLKNNDYLDSLLTRADSLCNDLDDMEDRSIGEKVREYELEKKSRSKSESRFIMGGLLFCANGLGLILYGAKNNAKKVERNE